MPTTVGLQILNPSSTPEISPTINPLLPALKPSSSPSIINNSADFSLQGMRALNHPQSSNYDDDLSPAWQQRRNTTKIQRPVLLPTIRSPLSFTPKSKPSHAAQASRFRESSSRKKATSYNNLSKDHNRPDRSHELRLRPAFGSYHNEKKVKTPKPASTPSQLFLSPTLTDKPQWSANSANQTNESLEPSTPIKGKHKTTTSDTMSSSKFNRISTLPTNTGDSDAGAVDNNTVSTPFSPTLAIVPLSKNASGKMTTLACLASFPRPNLVEGQYFLL